MFRRILDRLQIDKTLSYALRTRVWQAITGPITIALVVKTLNEDQTGVFTVLIGLLNIQALFELGLLNVLIGHVGHAWTDLTESNKTGQSQARYRLRELIRQSHRWFAIASVLFAAVAYALGWLTLSRSDTQTLWQWPLLALVPLAAAVVYFSPAIAVLEGGGQRETVYRFAFYTRVMGSFAVWATLLAGFGIWALVASAFVQLIWTAYLPLVHKRQFFRDVAAGGTHDDETNATDFSWRRDVVPAQWRAATGSIAFHLATQYFVIILAYYHSTALAGRLGLTLMITGAIQMFALAWVQTKFSLVSAQHAKGDRESAGTLWRSTSVISSSILVMFFLVLTAILGLLPTIEAYQAPLGLKDRDLTARFISPLQCIILGIGCFSSHLVALQGFYVLSRKANPLVVATTIGYLSTAALVWAGGVYYEVNGIVCGFALGTTAVVLPIHTIAYSRFRARIADSENITAPIASGDTR